MVWGFLLTVVISYVLSSLLAPKPPKPERAGLDSFDFPTAEAGRPIPVLFGRKLIKSPNCVWYGDLQTERIKAKSLFSSTTIGYKYFLSFHLVLSLQSCDALHEIWYDQKRRYPAGLFSSAQESLTEYEDIQYATLFGESWQGKYMPGRSDQPQHGYLKALLSGVTLPSNAWEYLMYCFQTQDLPDIPAFRGVTSVVLQRFFIGEQPYVAPFWFDAERYPKEWQSNLAKIGLDANPVHIIRECLLDGEYGMAYNPADVHEESFIAAAQTLYDEGFGLSTIWDRSSEIQDFISEILKQIDASLFIDRITGQFRLKLIRNDYDLNEIPLLDESNVMEVHKFHRPQAGELVNSVTIRYWSRSTNKLDSLTVNDSALVADLGGSIGSQVDYSAVCDPALAVKIASRDLKALSYPYANATIYATREAASLNVGEVFLFSWPRYGVVEIVMRVVSVEWGAIGSEKVKIECIEDVFGVEEAIQVEPPPSAWTPPDYSAKPVQYHSVIEAPYYWIARQAGVSEANSLGEKGHFAITAIKPSGHVAEGELWIDAGDGYFDAGEIDFCARAALDGEIGVAATNISLKNHWDTDFIKLPIWAMIDDEIVRVDDLDVYGMVVGRGCMDTVPTNHSDGTEVMFVGNYYESNSEEYASGNTITAKILTVTANETLEIGDAPAQTLVFNSRAIRPYPPGRLRIAGQIDPAEVQGDFDIEWAHRDRTAQTGATIIDTDSTDIGPETGTTYSYEIRRVDTDALLDSGSDIAGTSVTILQTSLDYAGDILIRLWAVRDGHESWQKHERIVSNLGVE